MLDLTMFNLTVFIAVVLFFGGHVLQAFLIAEKINEGVDRKTSIFLSRINFLERRLDELEDRQMTEITKDN